MHLQGLTRVYFVYLFILKMLQGWIFFIFNISCLFVVVFRVACAADRVTCISYEQNKIPFLFLLFKLLVTPVNFKEIIKVIDSFIARFVCSHINHVVTLGVCPRQAYV